MISKEELNELYWNQKLSLSQIAKQLGTHPKKVQVWMVAYGIPRRAFSTKGLPGSMLGKHMTEQAKRLLSNAKRGRKLSPEQAKKVTAHLKDYRWGNKNPNWKGGIVKTDSGYLFVRIDKHPRRNSGGYVGIHILELEKKIGRYLAKDEVCHHIDENKLNNHPDNLQLMTFSEHSRHHATSREQYKVMVKAKRDRNKRKDK